ncbi:coat protein [Melochia yellow mosaic virus]|uniref:Capsid protein n=1 Tax=Melochia yellow mosaic virus TaxID=1742595 RepID=A0A0P0KN45_9GEMI|nr:coat protein [Melochia yellow mosaic virus]ALK27180.1 coat protein [Melochia yellow mosaic virus]
MPKREAPWRAMAGSSKVSRALNYSPRGGIRPKFDKASAWVNRPMYRKPRIYRTMRGPDIPKGCEGPCKVQSYEQRHDVSHVGKVMCISDITRGNGITHRVGKRFCVKSVYILGKVWMDDNIKLKNHTNSVMFWLVRDRRPYGTPMDFGQVFNMFDNEPSTATVKNDLRDRFQVMHKFYAKVTGGQYASNEQALVRRFWKVNNPCDLQPSGGREIREPYGERLVIVYGMYSCVYPVYATLKIRIYFYDSISN